MTDVVAVMMVRDEEDILGYTLEHLLAEGVDRIVVANNRSTDGTADILKLYADPNFGNFPVTVVDDPHIMYTQSNKMTDLARSTCKEGDWVVPVDADELWFATDGQRLADMLRDCPASVCTAGPLVHVPHPDDDPTIANPFLRVVRHVTHPEQNNKVAFRWCPTAHLDMGNHGVTGVGGNRAEGALSVRHFQYRTVDQVRRKVTNGVEAVNQMAETYCTHWRTLAALDGAGLQAWWDDYCRQATVVDPAPWSPLPPPTTTGLMNMTVRAALEGGA